jgi:hypothetical protein
MGRRLPADQRGTLFSASRPCVSPSILRQAQDSGQAPRVGPPSAGWRPSAPTMPDGTSMVLGSFPGRKGLRPSGREHTAQTQTTTQPHIPSAILAPIDRLPASWLNKTLFFTLYVFHKFSNNDKELQGQTHRRVL